MSIRATDFELTPLGDESLRARLIRLVERNCELQADNRHLRSDLHRLQRLAYLDPLTELPNRRYFERVIAAELRRAIRTSSALTVVICTIDLFKDFNDRFGQATGDAVLVEVAGTLQRCCRRGSDLIARLGGEEFAIVLPGLREKECRAVIENLTQKIAASCRPRGDRPVTLSIGAATFAGHGEWTVEYLMARADDALNAAKKAGRNTAALSPHN